MKKKSFIEKDFFRGLSKKSCSLKEEKLIFFWL